MKYLVVNVNFSYITMNRVERELIGLLKNSLQT